MASVVPYKQKYKLQQRKQKFRKQIQQDKDKILIIVQKHTKSKLPEITPKFSCEKHYKFNMIKNMLTAKIKQKAGPNKISGQDSFFVYVGAHIPKGEQTMQEIYQKYKDQDGFLYLTYQQMESFGGLN